MTVVTHLGSSSLLLPIIVLMAAGLWQMRQTATLRVWSVGLSVAVVLTLATKIAFMGWGLGISALDFTGISGHGLLATAVLPVLLALVLSARHRSLALPVGLGIGALVAVSRVALDKHSVSEVVLAWFLGSVVAWAAVRKLDSAVRPPGYVTAAPLLLLFAFNTSAATYLPSHDLEIRLALMLSGRDTPYSRFLGQR